MHIKIFTLLTLIILLFSCKSVKNSMTSQELESLKAITKKDTITIESNWAYPQNPSLIYNTGLLPIGSGGGNINLIGNANHFKIIKDSLSISLPYFGERQMGAGYNTDKAGINFNGKPMTFKSTFNSKKNIHEYFFELKNRTENFQINLIIHSNLNTDIRINTNQRTSISYRGKIL